MTFCSIFKRVSAAIIFFTINSTFAADYSLEITNIKPAGTGNPAISGGNRIFKAYPGIEYNIRAAVIGGKYPYTYHLTKMPAGMSVDTSTGEINWKNPAASADAAITVKDAENREASASWTITVTTAGFVFIDSSAADPGTGAIASPFKRMMDIMGADKYDKKYNECIVYFRKGTYDLEGYPDNENDSTRIIFNNKPVVWMAYPGEKVCIDFRRRNFAQWTDYNIYHEGFEIKNCGNHGFQTGSHYSTFRKLHFHDLIDIIGGHNNQSFLCLSSGGYANVIQDCDFSTLHAGCDIKLYGHTKCLIENNMVSNNSANEGFAVKMSNDTVIIRGNIFSAMSRGAAITIDAYLGDGKGCRNTEISHNQILDCGKAMILGSNGALGPTYIHKNKIQGTPSIRYVKVSEGPVTFSDNVIVNQHSDAGMTTSDNYYRNKVWFDCSPNVYNVNVFITNTDSTAVPIKNEHSFFFAREHVQTANGMNRSFDMFGRRIVVSGNHAPLIRITKKSGTANTKSILW